jgi:cathepsin D
MAGFWSKDSVTIASTITATGTYVGEATKLNGLSFIASKFDGILGMAWPAISIDGVNPLFMDLWLQKKVDANSFAFFLTSKPNSDGSALVLGGVDP